MQTSFELEKNIKASAYTLVICGLLAILFFLLQWDLPQIPVPITDTGIEVNLGNSETGLGDVAPQLPGTPSSADQTNIAPPPAATIVTPEKNITPSDNGDEEINTVHKTAPPSTHPLPVNNSVNRRHSVNTVASTTPKPVMPKALYKGGATNGNGGNYADSYNGVQNQGIAGGRGDQGKPNGNPNSDSYTGNGGTGKSGVSIRNGLDGRRFTRLPSFEDDFNEPAKVAVDIVVDMNGNVTNASINPRGTTTTNANIRGIAIRKARQLKLNTGKDDEQSGTIVFDFKLKG